MSSEVGENLRGLLTKLDSANQGKRFPWIGQVRLVAVSKTFPAGKVREAYRAGCLDFGENRIQEMLEKAASLPEDIVWHFIGRLQTNKVKALLDFHESRPDGRVWLHSVDRSELARRIEEEAAKRQMKRVECLLQVNSTGEETKAGFTFEECRQFIRSFSFNKLIPRGIMTIGPHVEDPARIRQAFHQTREFFDTLRREESRFALDWLSMGMSQDYEIALDEGANVIRLGSAVFGKRIPAAEET